MLTAVPAGSVLCMRDVSAPSVAALLGRYSLDTEWLENDAHIRGSFWGAPEAGIIGTRVYVRPDTPVHSFLHETCHVICMEPVLRSWHTGNAGSDDLEEAAVCYLQILLADALAGVGRDRIMQDMDRWGYSFRLGSTRSWFEGDADDARAWLLAHKLIGPTDRPTWKLRHKPSLEQ